MNFYSESLDEIIKELDADVERGLSTEQATYRLEQYGANKLNEKSPPTLFQRFIEQMKDVMIIVLLAACAISFALAAFEATHGKKADWAEPIAIIVIVLLNAALGVFQESKAEAALEALKNMSKPNAKVRRNGTEAVIPSACLVPGDLLLLEAGDIIPADARVIEGAALKSDESSLTGESLPVEKNAAAEVAADVPLGDRLNMVYAGCTVTYGRGVALTVATGMSAEMGKIASLLESSEDKTTPLQKKLAQLGKYLAIIALAICAVIFLIGIRAQLPLREIFMISVSLAVAAIPEGLPAIVTIALAIGVQKMAAERAIVRRLLAVETLGSASVICTDKTGTLTQNRMTLVKAYAGEGVAVLDNPTNAVENLIMYGALCSDGTVETTADGEKHFGDPTETAIVAAALHMGIEKTALSRSYKRLAEIPFDSERKLMTTINEIDGKIVAVVKGAPDRLLERCSGGDIAAALAANEEMSEEALRVLAVARRELNTLPSELDPLMIENDLTLLGLVGMIDPPRPEVPSSINECKEAGILTVMITGDHVTTASAIARELGILEEGGLAVSGTELAAMSDGYLADNIEKYRVYARVSPSDKIRIVNAWRQAGQVVAMTGDGVNDAPALKASDIGCAMGITGTDVAKGAADVILTDDNFATIVTAVRDGRVIYDNIRKSIQFLLSCNLGEIITIFVSMVLWKESPLLPIQLLWVNLVTDSLPALALAVEPAEYDIMKRRPRGRDESIFSGGVGFEAAWHGLMIGLLTLTAYYLGKTSGLSGSGPELGVTMAFAVLAISQLVHSMNLRSSHSLFKIGFVSNMYVIAALFFSLLLMLAVLLVPQLRELFGTTGMGSQAWLIVITLSTAPFFICEAVKLLATFGGRDSR